MEEQKVSLQVSYLLAEHGFYDNRPCCIIPTQSIVQRWLRDKKGVIVLVTLDSIGMGFSVTSDTIDYKDSKHYLSYESALENGLYMALKLL